MYKTHHTMPLSRELELLYSRLDALKSPQKPREDSNFQTYVYLSILANQGYSSSGNNSREISRTSSMSGQWTSDNFF